MLKAPAGRFGLQPVHKSSRIIWPLGPEVCSSHCPARTVPQGHKDDNAYARDNSPAYPKDELFRNLFRHALRSERVSET
jgi:hypothetical protein